MKCRKMFEPNTTNTSPRRTRALTVAIFMQTSCVASLEIPTLMLVVFLGDSLDAGPVEKGFEHVFSFEDFARNIESGARVFRVSGLFWFSLATNERPDVITLVVFEPCD